MRLRLLAPVLLVLAVTAAAFALTQIESGRDAALVAAAALALAAFAGALVVATERRRRATREVERFFALSPEMVIVAGFDGYWKRVNPAVETVLGYGEREALARPFMELVHPDDRKRTEEEAGRVLAGTTTHAFENRLLCKDGSYKRIEWTVTPVPEQRVMYGVGRDVTERRRSDREQAALRRVATLVAQEVPRPEVFSAIAEEIGQLLGAEEVRMMRFDSDGTAIIVGCAGRPDVFALGSRQHLKGDSVPRRVLRTGRPARIDDYGGAAGSLDEAARSIGLRAAVGVPVFVEGRLWGVVAIGSTHEEPLPADTETRLGEFTELMATAIANAEARAEVQRLADEQAALRRMATLVARGTPPDAVFQAVADEVVALLGCDTSAIARFEADGTATLLGGHRARRKLGERFLPDHDYVLAAVRESGDAARFDTDDPAAAEMPEPVRLEGIRSGLATPIVADGELWGAITVASLATPFPPGTERRLADFTDLIATAIANTQARDRVTHVAAEQAALRRVATLVARDAPSTDVFDVVATEVGKLLDTDITVVGRYDGDGSATAIGSWSASPGGVPVGTRSTLGGRNVLTIVAETGEPARVDGYDDATGEAADIARSHGWRSSIAAPIVVEDRLWGVMLVATQRLDAFPSGAEEQLAAFTDLVATALANAESREALERLVQEQAALRRVATLVAGDAAPEEIFAAVTDEVATIFESITAIQRFDHDGPAVVFAGVSKGVDIPIGTRWAFADGMASAEVYRTGLSARLDGVDWASRSEPAAAAGSRLGIVSQVGTPILVGGRLWGSVSVNAREQLPPDTEQRLENFTELVATAIANAESKSELAASRRRIVAASDETRRQIERDLHDGTQQRLVSLGLAVRAAEANVPSERQDLHDELSHVAQGLADAAEDLQEISRGIHPAILSKGGLGPALRTLAHRSAIPVDLDIATDVRPAEPIEVATYYVASEALANAAKHSEASRIDLSLEQRDGTLLLSISDDGVGGVDAARGSGLVGLGDRVEALGGAIRIVSRPGEGTHITATLPLELESPRRAETEAQEDGR